jgi:putative peptidoglycan lipid II flippase
VALGTIVANALQVLKLIITSAWFGATIGVLDPYFIALSVPLTFQGIIIGALNASFIPVYVGLLAEKKYHRASVVLKSTFTFGLIFYSVLGIAIAVFARPILSVLAGGFSAAELQLNISLLRLLALTVLLNGICELLFAFFNAHKRYFLSAFSPALGIVISTGYLVAFKSQGIYALVYGLIFGSLGQLVVLLFAATLTRDFQLGLSGSFLSGRFWPVYRMMLPVAGGLVIGHANLLVDQSVASHLGKGTVSVLSYATRLQDVVVKLSVLSVGSALLPFLSQFVAEKKFSELRSTLSLANRFALIILVPSSALIFYFAPQVICAIFQRNLFSLKDTLSVSKTWFAYSIGLFFIASSIFAGRCLTALRDLHPLWIAAAIGIPINVFMDIYLGSAFGAVGIALGTVCVYFFYAVFYKVHLLRVYRKLGIASPALSSLWRCLVAICLFFVTCWGMATMLHYYYQLPVVPTLSDRLRLLVVSFSGSATCIGIYVVALKLLKVSELNLLFATRKRPKGLHSQ